MEIDKGVATLMAALLAAVLSGLTLLQKKSIEIREANRKYLETEHMSVTGCMMSYGQLVKIATSRKRSTHYKTS